MKKPVFPLIVIDKKYFLDIQKEAHKLLKLRACYLNLYQDDVYYDILGNKWACKIKMQKEFKPNFWQKIIYATIYSPYLEVEETWEYVGNYQFAFLKEELKLCVDKDDDIITQFVDANELKINIENCTTFEQIINVLNQHVFEAEETDFEDENNLEN